MNSPDRRAEEGEILELISDVLSEFQSSDRIPEINSDTNLALLDPTEVAEACFVLKEKYGIDVEEEFTSSTPKKLVAYINQELEYQQA